jgi:cytochrome c oxidase subunit 4
MKFDSVRGDLFVWIALLVLLALTVGTSFIPMGRINLIVNLAIAAAKALLVAVFFMHVWRGGALVRFVALVGLAWLAILVLLSANDFATRAL